jgi:hypothetical protein
MPIVRLKRLPKDLKMPSKSRSQARLFAAVAHSPSFAKKVGIPQSVGRDFNEADTGKGLLSGPRPKKRRKKPGQGLLGR